MKAVTVQPDFDKRHNAFYIQGLRALFGARNIAYSYADFPKFERLWGVCPFAMIVHGDVERRIFIDVQDQRDFYESGLSWSDVYAKKNLDPNFIPEDHASKIISAGPTFPIRIYPPLAALYYALRTFSPASTNSPREHFANHYRQLKYHLPEGAYRTGVSQRDYIFFRSSLWGSGMEGNLARARFIEACRSLPGVQFEGGFIPRSKNDIPGFEHLTVEAPITPIREYIRKTQASAVVFNTPAVLQCHSWKLGEFLALGKAIISIPLERLVPVPLVHGKHIHYVENSVEAIRDAVQRICSDDVYRRQLEQGARAYYVEHLQPSAVVKRILEIAAPGSSLPSDNGRPPVAQDEFARKSGSRTGAE